VTHPIQRAYRTLRFGTPIVVVSGLPRSGTSMAMSMLEAGGLEIVADGARVADEHNPRGYYEDERVKTLEAGEDTAWLETARGKAIKVISFLLPHLPTRHNYRVVFMHRDMGEILISQGKMLNQAGLPDPEADRRMGKAFEDHLGAVAKLLRRRTCFEVLDLRYEEVLNHPLDHAHRITKFVGMPLDAPRMAAAVQQALYRNRR